MAPPVNGSTIQVSVPHDGRLSAVNRVNPTSAGQTKQTVSGPAATAQTDLENGLGPTFDFVKHTRRGTIDFLFFFAHGHSSCFARGIRVGWVFWSIQARGFFWLCPCFSFSRASDSLVSLWPAGQPASQPAGMDEVRWWWAKCINAQQPQRSSHGQQSSGPGSGKVGLAGEGRGVVVGWLVGSLSGVC